MTTQHSRYRLARLLLSALMYCGLATVGAVHASATAPSTTVTEVARELVCNCPDCGHQAVDQCGHCAYADKYRAEIKADLNAGQGKQQILNSFANRYGEQILGNPRPRGFNRVATLMPLLIALCALLPLGLVLRHRTARITPRQAPHAGTGAAPAGPEDPRVAEALRGFDF